MRHDFNKIDDFLKEQVESSHFPVNEAHWEDALRRLHPEDNKKRPLFWFITLGLILGVSTLSIGLYNNYGTALGNTAQKSNNTVAARTAVNNSAQASSMVERVSKMNEEALTQGSNEADVQAQANVVQPINTTDNHLMAASNNTKATAQAITANRQQQAAEFISKQAPLVNNTQRTNKQSKAAEQIKTAATEAIAVKKKAANKTNNKFAAKHADAIITDKANIDPINGLSNKAGIATEQESSNAKTAYVSETTKTKPIIYKSVAEMQAMNPRYVAGLENYKYEITDIQLDAAASDAIRAQANAQANAQTAKTDKPIKIISAQQVERDFNSVYLFAGLSAAKGYRGNTTDKAVYGLSPNIGVGYQLAVSNKVNVYFSLFASYLNHLNINETSKQTTYSFDKTTKEIEIARKNLIQLHMPITAGLRLRERHTLLGGIGLIYGVNTLSSVNTKEQNVNEFGYMSGLRTMDANIHIGYEYKISDAFRINIMYQEGLIDMTQNEYFNNNQEDRNRRISIGVRYNLNKR